jgi:hypothetical protein
LRIQKNYDTQSWSQFDYVKNVMGAEPPYGWEYSTVRLLWVMFFMVVPLLLALVSGIWAMIGNGTQVGSSLLCFAVLILYIGLVVSLPFYFPDDYYCRGIAGVLNLVFSGAASLIAIVALTRKEQVEEAPVMTEIPQIKEMKQEQVVARYNIIAENATEETVVLKGASSGTVSQPASSDTTESQEPEPKPDAYVPGNPRGVMVGLTGMYAGAEIPFQDGERIKLGRLPDNDLVFEGQEKVSRNHCYIKWDAENQKYIFCDYSSNGTYVNGSEDCLPQNLELPIEPGTIIAIGDEQNTFRLE